MSWWGEEGVGEEDVTLHLYSATGVSPATGMSGAASGSTDRRRFRRLVGSGEGRTACQMAC